MGMVPLGRVVVRSSHELSLSRLDQKGLRLYSFLLRRIGFKAVPVPVALSYMVKGSGMSLKQVRRRLDVMVELGIIQRWTVKHPEHFKKSFYRIVYIGDRRALYRSDSMGTRT
jgi:hypothetical protein